MNDIEIFKNEASKWIDDIASDLLGDGVKGKLLRPIISEIVDKNRNNPVVDMFLSTFIKDGRLNIDSLLDKYIEAFATEDGIRFKWKDINPMLSILGDNTNVIYAEDIKVFKENLLNAIRKGK